MKHDGRFFSTSSLFGGLILLLGILLTLDNLEVLEFGSVFRLWPLLLVAWGLALLLRRGGTLRRLLGGIIAIAGVVLLLGNLGLWDVDFSDLWPLLLVAVGLAILFGARTGGSGMCGKAASEDQFVRRWVAMGALEQKITSRNLQGGELTTVMGGIELDLREAEMAGEEAVVEVFALMGAVELQVPVGWSVSSDVVALMGAVEDKTRAQVNVEGPPRRLVLKGFAIMGGVEVKN
jgi:predicted membrane protein